MVKEIGGRQLVNSSNNMGYLNSVLSSSSQVHAEDAPVSGGGLRLIFFWFRLWFFVEFDVFSLIFMCIWWICYIYLLLLLFFCIICHELWIFSACIVWCCYSKLWFIYCCGLMFLILQYQGLIVSIGNLVCLIPKCEALLMWVFVYKFITHWG